MPFCLGITIQNLSTFTANDFWEKEFITEKDIWNKVLKMDNFSAFLNFKQDISYKNMAKDFTSDMLTGELSDEYLSLKRKDEKVALELVKYNILFHQRYKANYTTRILFQTFELKQD